MHNRFCNDNSGFSLVELLIVLGIGGILLSIGLQLFSGSSQNYRKNQINQDLHNLRTLVATAHCRRTMDLPENAGKACNTSTPVRLILASDYRRMIPGEYNKERIGRLGSLSLKVECRNDRVAYYYAKISGKGALIADAELGIKAEWADLFAGKYRGFKPFSKYATDCD